MKYETIRIVHNDNGMTIEAMIENGRKSTPTISQRYVSNEVQEMHNSVKSVSSYVGTSFHMDEIDEYDSDVNMFTVAGAMIKRGQRSVTDTSWRCGTIPKGWLATLAVKFTKVQKTTRPLSLALDILGVRVNVNDIQKILKKNGEAYINGELNSSGFFSSGSYTYTVSSEDQRETW